MSTKDPQIVRLIETRWRQFTTIFWPAASPAVFVDQVRRLLSQWYDENPALLVSQVDDEPREQWLVVQSYLNDVEQSATPHATLRALQRCWAQIDAEDLLTPRHA